MTNGDYKFGIEVPDAMISDATKKKEGYMYYMAKKVETNAPNKLKKYDVPRKTRSLTIVEETVVCELAHSINTYAEWGQKLKVQSSDKTKESANETDDADEFDMDLSDDNPNGDDDAARYGVFMHNKSTTTLNSTYLSMTITSSYLDFIQTLLDETPAKELTDFMSHLVYTDAQTTSVVHNPEGNPKEIFPNENAHHLSSQLATKTSNLTIYPKPSSLQAKAKKLMQNTKQNMRKINFKKAVPQKFRECDQKLEALTNFNVSKAFEKVVQQALDAQDAGPSFHKRCHNNQDSPNNHEDENKKKRRKDVGEPSSRSSRRNKSPMIHAQVDTPAMQPLDQEDEYVRKHPYPEWFPKKPGQLKAAVLTEAKWNSDEYEVSKPRTFEGHMNNTKPHPSFYNNDFYYLMNLSTEEKYATSITKHYTARYHIQGIDQKIPFTTSETHTGVVYLNQHNVKSFMKLSEVKKFCDGTLMKIRENLVNMVKRNKLGTAKIVAPLPLLEELSRAAESDVTNDQLIVLFEIEVAEDAEKVRDFRKLSTELREVVRRRYGYVAELRVLRSCDDALGTIEMLSHMQLDDMEKAARLLLMANESRLKWMRRPLDSLPSRLVSEKTSDFVKVIGDRYREKVLKLQILAREMDLNARDMDFAIQKLKDVSF
uniref:Uncharacterized protein n=1 Tax=Tanacetum cinerariifolium TaxID=118510 RepID=A0A6L2LIW8_TANCI|nr:hypothetical protein [Tanacetum cinerariifolium]